MSAIAKPHIYFSGATAPQNTELVPVDWIFSMEKFQEAKSVTDTTIQYYIVVNFVPAVNGNVRSKKILFDTSGHRDFAYAAAYAALGLAIASS